MNLVFYLWKNLYLYSFMYDLSNSESLTWFTKIYALGFYKFEAYLMGMYFIYRSTKATQMLYYSLNRMLLDCNTQFMLDLFRFDMENRVIPGLLASKLLDRVSSFVYDTLCHGCFCRQKLKQWFTLHSLYSLTVVQPIAHVFQAAVRDIYKFTNLHISIFMFYARIWCNISITI